MRSQRPSTRMIGRAIERLMCAKHCKLHTKPSAEQLAPAVLCVKCAAVECVLMLMKSSVMKKTRMMPVAMAKRVEFVLRAVAPLGGPKLRTSMMKAQVSQLAVGLEV